MKVKQTGLDSYTWEIVPEDLVRAAIMEEFDYVSEKTVLAAAECSEMKSDSSSIVVCRMRWVFCVMRRHQT